MTMTVLLPGEKAYQAPRGQGPVKRLWQILYAHFVGPLVLSMHPPWFDARGVALGLVVGFGVPMGGHTLTLGLLRLVVRFNFVVAFGAAALVNPISIIPVYYGYYCLGSWILGKPAELDRHLFESLMEPVLDKIHFWQAIRAFMELGADILSRWVVAAILVSLVLGVAGYALTLKIQRKRCRKGAENLGIRYEEYVSRLERASSHEASPTVEPPTRTESVK